MYGLILHCINLFVAGNATHTLPEGSNHLQIPTFKAAPFSRKKGSDGKTKKGYGKGQDVPDLRDGNLVRQRPRPFTIINM